MTDKEKLDAIRVEVQNYIDAAHKAHTNITEGNFAHLLSFIDSLQKEPVKIKKGCKYRCLSDMQNTDTGAISFFKDKIYSAPEDDTLVSEEYGWLCDTSENSSNFELVEEPVSEDLEETATKYAEKKCFLENAVFTDGEMLIAKAKQRFDFYNLATAFEDGANWQKERVLKAMDLGEPPYLISVEQAYYNVKKLLED